MRLLDLFCGAGGAAMGYTRAGFDVVGVDIVPQPRYPFEFHRADALTFPLDGFDVIHASPPCADHTSATARDRARNGHKGTGHLLAVTLDRLRSGATPWVVENVAQARFGCPTVTLCGSSFGLDVRRHRQFASSLPFVVPPCDHASQTPRFVSLYSKMRKEGRLSGIVGVHGSLTYAGKRAVREQAMDIAWMTPAELTQAIPPAYTEHLGRQLIEQLRAAA